VAEPPLETEQRRGRRSKQPSPDCSPRLGFSFIDVRDVAALEVGAMTAADAGGQRLIAAASFLWLSEVAAILREQLGPDARKVPRRGVHPTRRLAFSSE
jgi:nucleoside-diphosphate-sugar epimerase